LTRVFRKSMKSTGRCVERFGTPWHRAQLSILLTQSRGSLPISSA
jgi:hypothetical protein